MLSSIFISAIPPIFRRNNVRIILESLEKPAKKTDIVKSVIVLKNRLNSAGFWYKLRLKDDKTISVVFKSESDFLAAKSLITAKGSLGLFLPFENEQALNKLLDSDKLSLIYNGSARASFNSETCVLEVSDCEKNTVDSIFRNTMLASTEFADLEIAWSRNTNENIMWELHLLNKTNSIDGSNIEKSYGQLDNNTNTPEVMIEFSEEGSKLFSNLTSENIGKNLSIVVDGIVYSSPKIMNKIEGGKCTITGNFSKQEARDLAALIQNGNLPLEFRITRKK